MVKCQNCKSEIKDEVKFCSNCGKEIKIKIEKKIENKKIKYIELGKYNLSKEFWVSLVLLFFSFLIIPLIFLLGYIIKVGRESLSNKLPKFEKLGEMFKEGFFTLCIILLYFIIPLILSIITLSSLGAMEDIKSLYAINLTLFMKAGASGFFTLLITFIISFIFPFALITYANTKQIKSAFQLNLIFKKIFNKFNTYSNIFFFTLVISILVNLIMHLIKSLLINLSLFGLILFVLLNSVIWTYVLIIFMRLFNKFYKTI